MTNHEPPDPSRGEWSTRKVFLVTLLVMFKVLALVLLARFDATQFVYAGF